MGLPTPFFRGPIQLDNLNEVNTFFFGRVDPFGVFVVGAPKTAFLDQLYGDAAQDVEVPDDGGLAFLFADPVSKDLAWALIYIDTTKREEFSDAKLRYILTHEFGHALGLSHSSVRLSSDDLLLRFARQLGPIMYPQSSPELTAWTVWESDRSWLSFLYPTDSNPRATWIRGRVLDAAGRPLPGINVVAVPLDAVAERDSQSVGASRRVSTIADFLGRNDGEFFLPVPPGVYVLFAESVPTADRRGQELGPDFMRLPGAGGAARTVTGQFRARSSQGVVLHRRAGSVDTRKDAQNNITFVLDASTRALTQR